MISLKHRCNKCGYQFEKEHRTFFEVSDASSLIFDDEECVFRTQCPHCKYYFTIQYPMYYHDAKHKWLCHLGCNGDEAGPCFSPQVGEYLNSHYDLINYRLRECRSTSELIEKICIALCGLDDITMEYVKYFTRKSAGSGSDGNELRFFRAEKDTIYFQRWNDKGEGLQDWRQHFSVYTLAEKTIQQMKKDGSFCETQGFIRVTEDMWQVFRNPYFEKTKLLRI